MNPIIIFTDAVLAWADVNSSNPDAATLSKGERGGVEVRVPRTRNFSALFHFDGGNRVSVKRRASKQANWERYSLSEFVALVEGGELFA